MVKVKICGITNLEDALAACEYGADALGFVFYKKSPRYVDVKIARDIIKSLPPFVETVGVFVDEAADRINEIADAAKLDIIQLHGDEPPQFCNSFKKRVVKVFKIRGQGSGVRIMLSAFSLYHVSAYLLDTYQEDSHGGTGKTFNWDVVKKVKKFGKIILAGGLTPENVADAIKTVKPYAVDVSSGVEKKPGKKDLKKVREFIERAKGIK